MKTSALLTRPLAALGLGVALCTPGLALAQDAAGTDITRDLNSGPPVVIATPPPVLPEPGPQPGPADGPADSAPPVADARPAPAPAPAPTSTPAPDPEPVAAAEPAPVPAPEPAPLTLAERRALPFRVDLPEGAGIYPGRSGPDFDIFSVRREGRGLLMIYVGPQSQFPIYSGEQRERGGRRSIVVSESGRTLALEHLFRLRGGTELHVWVSAVSDEDRALADAIGHTIEPR